MQPLKSHFPEVGSAAVFRGLVEINRGCRRGCKQCLYLGPIADAALSLRHAIRREPAL